MAKINAKTLEIGVSCKTQKEYYVMVTLIVYIQSCYRQKFAKTKQISFRKLVECAIRELEKRGSAFYPFSKNKLK